MTWNAPGIPNHKAGVNGTVDYVPRPLHRMATIIRTIAATASVAGSVTATAAMASMVGVADFMGWRRTQVNSQESDNPSAAEVTQRLPTLFGRGRSVWSERQELARPAPAGSTLIAARLRATTASASPPRREVVSIDLQRRFSSVAPNHRSRHNHLQLYAVLEQDRPVNEKCYTQSWC